MSKLLIVADAGGTRTEWYVRLSDSKEAKIFETSGINATIGSESEIANSVAHMRCLIEDAGLFEEEIIIYFYGAGYNSETNGKKLRIAFNDVFSDGKIELVLRSDLSGAGVALFGEESGIACIIGTGSSSGFYDGHTITETVPSLGYLLGDEGSGASMGKDLINRYFKGELSNEVKSYLETYCQMEMSGILQKVYKEPGANKFLASFVPFIKEHEEEKEITNLIESNLKLFFKKNVLKYSCPSGCKIRFVGGVAHVFSNRIKTIASNYGLIADRFLPKPIEHLGAAHRI